MAVLLAAESGMIFDAARPGSLKSIMRRLFHNPELRDRLAEGAQENAAQSSWHEVLDDLWQAKTPAAAAASYRRIRGGAAAKLVSLDVA